MKGKSIKLRDDHEEGHLFSLQKVKILEAEITVEKMMDLTT